MLIKRSLFFFSFVKIVFSVVFSRSHIWLCVCFWFRTPAVVYNFSSLCLIIIVHQNPDLLLKHRKKYVNDFFCSFYFILFIFVLSGPTPAPTPSLSIASYLSLLEFIYFHLLLLLVVTIKMCISKSRIREFLSLDGSCCKWIRLFCFLVCSFDSVHFVQCTHSHLYIFWYYWFPFANKTPTFVFVVCARAFISRFGFVMP